MSSPARERGVVIGADPSPPDKPRSLRPLVLRLHFYAGIFVAPFIFIATISGGLYAIAPTLEEFVYSDYLQVDSVGTPAPVSEQVDAARAVQPDLTLAAVRPATESGDTTRVMFTDPSLGESERRPVFIDPVTASSVGESVVYGSAGSLPMRTWISGLHRNLHLGEPGRLYSELAASWLWVIALGGVYLWIERFRRLRRSKGDKARLLTLDTSSKGRIRTLNWHGVAGIWIAVGLVFLSATGLTWSTYAGENVTELRSSLSWTTPAITKSLSGQAPTGGEHAGHGSAAPASGVVEQSAIDSVLEVARSNGVDGAVEVSVPASADTAFVVAQTRRPWQMSNDSIAVDGATGAVVDTVRFSEWPLAAKLSAWGIQLHMGTLFGLLNQLALVALAVALASVIVRGYMMWWKRGRGDTFGRVPARGGIRRVSPLAATALVVIVVAVGWFVPLLGISLLAFLVVDVVLGATLTRKKVS